MNTSLRQFLSALTVVAFAPAAIADAYLDALKAEAHAPPRTAAPASAPAPGTQPNLPVPRTDDQVQMEKWLQLEFMGTYVFYQKLSDHKKQVVYQMYRDGAPIEDLRVKINELLKQ